MVLSSPQLVKQKSASHWLDYQSEATTTMAIFQISWRPTVQQSLYNHRPRFIHSLYQTDPTTQ